MKKFLFFAVLAALVFSTIPNPSREAIAAPPVKADLPTSSFVCINYWPDGEYLGVRFKFVPVGSPQEVYEATYRDAILEIATEHGRQDLVAKVLKEGVHIKDRATFTAEHFDPESLLASATAGDQPLSTRGPDYTTDSTRRRRPGRGVGCTCSSLTCSADVCGKWYCSGACGGCNLCG